MLVGILCYLATKAILISYVGLRAAKVMILAKASENGFVTLTKMYFVGFRCTHINIHTVHTHKT